MSQCILSRSVFNPSVRVEYNDELHSDPDSKHEEWVWPFPIPEENARAFLSELLKMLTEQQNMVITLRFYGEMSFAAIALQMGLKKTTVYDYYLGAIKKLQKAGEKYRTNGIG